MLGFALALLVAQRSEPVATPAPAAAAEAPQQLRLAPSAVLQFGLGGGLAAVERDLIQLHARLRPVLVKVAISIPLADAADGSARRQDIQVSGVVVDHGGLFIAPGLGPVSVARVIRFDGEEYEAWPVARDHELGLTLFCAPELAVQPPALGSPGSLRVGMVALTLGNPFGLDGTLDLGFVSGLDRRVDDLAGLVQITNTVNPGDGGGLVANRFGQVIGVMKTSLREVGSRKLGSEGAGDCVDGCEELVRSESLSFAIPIDQVLVAFQDHLSVQIPRTHWLGVLVKESYAPELAAELGFPGQILLRLEEVNPGSPAGAAGLAPGDYLCRLGEMPLLDLGCLRYALSVSPAKQSIPLVFVRDGNLVTASVQLGWQRPKDLIDRSGR